MNARHSSRRRVVVTGLGAICAAGLTKEEFWESLLAGRSGIGPITRFDATGMASRIAGEVKNFDPINQIDAGLRPRRMSRQTQLGVVAAMEALQDAGLEPELLRKQSVITVGGVCTSSAEQIAESALMVSKHGPLHGNRNVIATASPQALATTVSKLIEAKQNRCVSISTDCAAGLDAIGRGFRLIQEGQTSIAICGGADAPISPMPMAEFSLSGMGATLNEEPERAGRPFDRERSAGVLAEGAAMLVLEDLDFAQARDAHCYLEICGYDTGLDNDESRPAAGLEATMLGAISDSACSVQEIDYISAWGAGHPVLDHFETEAIRNVLGQRANDVAISSIKGIVGNPLGGGGPLQAVALAMSYRHGFLPPTTNCEHTDIFCELDYVRNKARRLNIRKALINAHGIGGNNSTLLTSKIS